jgi:valine--pyruvate aminotransferase
VVARPEVTKAISSMNAILSLAPGSFGAALTRDMVRTGEVLDISRDLIRPFYAEKSRAALGWLREALEGVSYRVHKPEGTFFFWIWFEGLPISCAELYARLKRRGVLIVPGHFFFPGLEGEWRHRHECIRLNFSQSDETVRRGVQILGDEVRAAFAAN